MSEYWILCLIAAGSVIGLVIMLNLADKLAKATFHHTHIGKGAQV